MLDIVYSTDAFRRNGHSDKTEFALDEYEVLVAQYPSDLLPPSPPEPTLDEVKARKIMELQMAFDAECAAGTKTSIGPVMMTADKDRAAVKEILEVTEEAGLPAIPLIVEADGTRHSNEYTLEQGKKMLLEMRQAMFAAYEKLGMLTSTVLAARTKTGVEKVKW